VDPVDLDARLDRELRELPPPHAPRTLLPRVLAAAAHREGRATATGWSTWPAAWRAVAAVVFLAAVAGASIFFSAPPQQLSGAAEKAGDVATVARVFWEVLARPVASYLFVLGVSLTLACALAWAALEAALGGASQR
jgi:hypothetical protein